MDLLSLGYLDYQWRNRNFTYFIRNILICVLKMNKSLIYLEQHEGE